MTSDFCIALHALVYLDHKGMALSSAALADNICANPARVRKVMAMLVDAGLALAREGLDGGYCSAKPAARIRLDDIARALDVSFASMSWRSGDSQKDCLVSSGMAGAMDRILARLNEACYKTLHAQTVADIEEELLNRRAKEKSRGRV